MSDGGTAGGAAGDTSGNRMESFFQPDLLSGRVAVITGGGTGLGFAMARTFANLGASLVLASRNRDHVGPAAEQLRQRGVDALAVTCDVRNRKQVNSMIARAVDEFGGLDILVNNAAGNFLVRAEELSERGWKAVTRIVLDGSWYCSQAAFEPLVEGGGGAILNILATYATGAGVLTVHSAAAKAGVLAITRTLAVEWAEYDIRVNAIAPGPVDTEGAGGALWSISEAREAIREKVPMERFGTEDEIARAAAFLVSDAATYVTGSLLPVDGGLTLGKGHFVEDPEVADKMLRKPGGDD